MPSNGTSKITLTLPGEGKGRGEIFIIQFTRTEQSHGVKEDFNLPFFGAGRPRELKHITGLKQTNKQTK